MCNHAIGFCQLIDNLIYINDTDRQKKEYLTEDCSYSALDIIFNHCPFCGEKIKRIRGL